VLLEWPVELLLVENSPADVRLVVEGLQESATPTHLSVVGDRQEALAFLRREGIHAAAPRPELVILDLDLPRKHGEMSLQKSRLMTR
jgi:chemotaxis family two-component system response regulator Rcp1